MIIGSNVKQIDGAAFRYCNALTSVISLNPIPPKVSSDNAFNTYSDAVLQVPEGSVDAYRVADVWKNFIWIEELDEDTDVEDVKVNNSTDEKIRYNMNGLQIEEPQQGVNIIQMSDGTTKKVLINRRQ